MKSRLQIIFLFLLLLNKFGFSQLDSLEVTDSLKLTDTVKVYSVTLLSIPEEAEVYNDTALIGITPIIRTDLKEGVYYLKFINPGSGKYWHNSNYLFDLDLKSDTVISVAFKYFYYFDSDPFNAKVISSDTLLGYTPLRLLNENKLTDNIIFRKENFKDLVFNIKDYDFEKGIKVTLQSKGKVKLNEEVYKDKGTQFNTSRNLPVIAGLGLATLTAGYFTFDFKNKANNLYDDYILTGNSESLDESNKNDIYFAISLILMQAAIGGLVYFLFFD